MGGFSSSTTFFANSPEFVLAEDLNRDGKLDLAVANPGPDQVSVLLGDGSGNFPDPVSFDAGLQPRSIAVADFDHNGAGNGQGGFGEALTLSVPSGPWSLTAGDFSRDGRIDLAVGALNDASVTLLVNTCGWSDPS